MFKLVIFKFILFIFYLLAALVAKFKGPSNQTVNNQMIDTNVFKESGVPTNWINPYITRYTTTTTATKTTTTTIFLRTKPTTKSRFLTALTNDNEK